jgi:hypothetical protein
MRDKNIQKREDRWRNRKPFRTSVQKIQRREINKRNMDSYAIKRALHFHSDGQICFPRVSENIEASYPPFPEDFVPDFVFNKERAKRLQVGWLYSPKYLEPYKLRIKSLQLRRKGQNNKMNPAKMLQRIQFQHPKKFCLLFINDV